MYVYLNFLHFYILLCFYSFCCFISNQTQRFPYDFSHICVFIVMIPLTNHKLLIKKWFNVLNTCGLGYNCPHLTRCLKAVLK